MDLPSAQLHQIRAGRKTQTRTPVGEPRWVSRKNNTRYLSQPFTPVQGHTVNLRAHGKHVERTVVTIIDVRQEPLGAIESKFTDVLAEGHRTTDEFKAWWIVRHDRQWATRHEDELAPDTVNARFVQRHADTPVWVLRFELDRSSRPRMLVPAGRRFGDELGYTDNVSGAMRDEPEAVDEQWQTRITERAGRDLEHWQLLDHAQRDAMQLHERLRTAQESARLAGVDISRQELSILQRIRSLESKIQKLAA